MAGFKVVVGADIRGFTDGMKQVSNLVQGLPGGLLGTRGLGAGASGAVAYIKNVVTELDGIGDSADKLGISTDLMQKLSYISKITGMDIGSLGWAFQRMKIAIEENDKSFRKLGLSTKDLKSLDTETQYKKIIEALSKVEDKEKRAKLTQDLFSRSAKEMKPLIDNFDRLSAEAEKFGLVISKSNIDSASGVADAWDRTWLSIRKGVATSGLIEYLDKAGKAAEVPALVKAQMMKTTGVNMSDIGERGMMMQMWTGGLGLQLLSSIRDAIVGGPQGTAKGTAGK